MKVICKGMEITCTPDEFEILMKKGLLGQTVTGDTHIGDEWNEAMKKAFEKLWEECGHDHQRSNPTPFDVVALYGCVAPRDRKDLSPYDVATAYGVNLPYGGFNPTATTNWQGLTNTATDKTSADSNTTDASATEQDKG